ncbi:unnamed protein product [Amaranthus hypochondriacus]
MGDNPIGFGNALGLLRIKIKRGVNLAIRDVNSSDPYVILRLANQYVYDHDTFSLDDKMGDAEFDIRPFLEAVKMNVEGLPNGTIIMKVRPERQNCMAEDSCIVWNDGKLTQNMFLRLRNVECGEVELQLQWIDLPASKLGA